MKAKYLMKAGEWIKSSTVNVISKVKESWTVNENWTMNERRTLNESSKLN